MRLITVSFIFIIAAALIISGCTENYNTGNPSAGRNFEDGVYRGAFFDKGHMEVNLQFTLKDNRVKDIKFRYLQYDGVDYLGYDPERTRGIREQFQELIEHLEGKDINESLNDLYFPARIITREVDGVSAATVRAGKAISALRDALNRGVYEHIK